MQKVQLIDVESSKRNAALPLHLACRGKLTESHPLPIPDKVELHLACRDEPTAICDIYRMLVFDVFCVQN